MDWAQRMIFYAAGPSYFSSSHDGVPDDGHTLPVDYYNTKKLIKDLGLRIEKIGACKNGCMLYCKDSVDLEYCKFCGDARYKPTRGQDLCRKKSPYAVLRYLSLTPRLQRSYSSRATVEHMMWHATHQTEEGSMCHPSYAEAWKHFNQMYPDFVEEPRNVWLGLCTDGFAPHASDQCVLGTVNRKLLQLWQVGVRMYDHATDNEFIMRAAWTDGLIWDGIWMEYHRGYGISDFFSLSNIPTKGTRITKNRVKNKRSQVDEESIFWDLPYWSTLLIRHNLDVMHIEKNVFDNIFNTVMNIKRKTKDNLNARWDLKNIYNRSELELDERRPNVMPKAAYTLSKEQKMRVCEWIKGLQFPDGYASNLARCVDMTKLRMHGMKSHDCHVFMQKLIPVAF
ncbi:UNVERIFIED_CONTAM: hypothetical protein Slati_0407500 [Sesamum latifolium]|uniref:Uncharacterized protein n=1 Tax=Sesamum latifolium TaxID=2727402 RepID=A0AAW2XV12_9LAMI